jgi:hypothetical protein
LERSDAGSGAVNHEKGTPFEFCAALNQDFNHRRLLLRVEFVVKTNEDDTRPGFGGLK